MTCHPERSEGPAVWPRRELYPYRSPKTLPPDGFERMPFQPRHILLPIVIPSKHEGAKRPSAPRGIRTSPPFFPADGPAFRSHRCADGQSVGGAAVHRCGNSTFLNTALAAEVISIHPNCAAPNLSPPCHPECSEVPLNRTVILTLSNAEGEGPAFARTGANDASTRQRTHAKALKGHGFSRAESFFPCHPEQARRSEAIKCAARDLQFSAFLFGGWDRFSDGTAAVTAPFE